MGEVDAAVLRDTVRFLDRYRGTIEDEVDRRLGRREPPPAARREVVRRFRSFSRLASIDLDSARPSLDGLGGNSPAALEQAIEVAVDVACLCEPEPSVAEALRSLEARFRTGIRRTLRPAEPERRARRGRRRALHGGRRLRAAIDRISDAYLALDLESGKLADLNPAAEALLGTPAVTLIEKPFADLLAPEAVARFADVEARLDAGEDVSPTVLHFRGAEGASVAAEVSAASHAISGRRLAVFVARERPEEAGRTETAPEAKPETTRAATDAEARQRRMHSSVSAVVRSLLGSND
jgi:PAS domain S-box-containing protein